MRPVRRLWDVAGELLRSRFLRDSGWMAASSVSALVSGLLFAWGFGRLAGPAVLGLLTLTQRVVEFVLVLIDLRLDEGLTRAVITYREAGQPGRGLSAILVAYGVDLALGVLALGVILFWVAPFASSYYQQPGLAALIRLYTLGMFLGTVNSSGIGVLQAFHRFREIGILFTLASVTELLFPLAAWGLGWGLTGVVGGLAASLLCYSTGLSWLTWRLVKTEYRGVRPVAVRETARDLLRFGGVVTLSGAMKTAFRNLDVLILGRFASSAQVGYYRVAMSYGNTVGFFAGPMGSVLFPKLTGYAVAGNWEKFREVNRRLIGWMLAASLPLGAGAVLLAPWLIPLVLKEAYAPALPAVTWIVLTAVLTNVSCYLRPAIVAVGRPGISVWTNALMAVALAWAAWILAPRSQHVGVAQAWFFTHLAGVLAGMWLLSRAMRSRRGSSGPLVSPEAFR